MNQLRKGVQHPDQQRVGGKIGHQGAIHSPLPAMFSSGQDCAGGYARSWQVLQCCPHTDERALLPPPLMAFAGGTLRWRRHDLASCESRSSSGLGSCTTSSTALANCRMPSREARDSVELALGPGLSGRGRRCRVSCGCERTSPCLQPRRRCARLPWVPPKEIALGRQFPVVFIDFLSFCWFCVSSLCS